MGHPVAHFSKKPSRAPPPLPWPACSYVIGSSLSQLNSLPLLTLFLSYLFRNETSLKAPFISLSAPNQALSAIAITTSHAAASPGYAEAFLLRALHLPSVRLQSSCALAAFLSFE